MHEAKMVLAVVETRPCQCDPQECRPSPSTIATASCCFLSLNFILATSQAIQMPNKSIGTSENQPSAFWLGRLVHTAQYRGKRRTSPVSTHIYVPPSDQPQPADSQ